MKYLQPELSLDDFRTLNFCVICDDETIFNIPENFWNCREQYTCKECNSTPRERNIMTLLRRYDENWWKLKIHEYCPLLHRGLSWKLNNSKIDYSYTIPDNDREVVDFTLDLKEDKIDVFILQDSFPYFINPKKVLNEIYNVLSDSGILIMTVPLLNGFEKTKQRVKVINDNRYEFIKDKIVHKNQLNKEGAVVCYDYGFDICRLISEDSKFSPLIFNQMNSNLSIIGDLNDVIFCAK